MQTKIFGITTCDTVRKARLWLRDHGVAHTFHDFRVDGVDRRQLEEWSNRIAWETLLNKASATFRRLPAEQKAEVDQATALTLMIDYPTLIKRPILETGLALEVGFSSTRYATLFA
ncbi:Spx/MgsR family RNA polymerase-binding regulatory protein [Mesorhizobium sp. NBSH29]|uniref:arsenate reductase n=1 Tax=Mesorhizobium sp. NBSH29 TaxID=2654249 RepID=UPI0018967AE1|nr:arsenate reductase [Mesorhizobium sp. NBSH29]QPC86963.1 Spx/MgsR family RNA polymerase-binding regulatory protein [Mesorhizobium sp. NBSH29]